MDEEGDIALSMVNELVSSSDIHYTRFTDKIQLIALSHTPNKYIFYFICFLHRNHPSLFSIIFVSRDRHVTAHHQYFANNFKAIVEVPDLDNVECDSVCVTPYNVHWVSQQRQQQLSPLLHG